MTRKLYCLTMLMFLLTAVHAQGLQGYEYWIDNDYAGRRAVSTTDADISFQLSADDIGQGVHFLNFHAQGTDGEWGPLSRHIFFVPEDISSHATVTQFELWIDNDYSTRQQVTVDGGSPAIAHSIDVSQLSEGVHYLNVRLQNCGGEWSTPSRHIFFNPGNDFAVNSPIVGYEYTLNGESKYVSIPEQMEYTMKDVLFDLPDPLLTSSPVGDRCTYTFTTTEATLKRQTPVSFSICFENKARNRSTPVGQELTLPDEVTHTMVALPMRQSVRLAKVAIGDFHALSLNLPKSQKYFLSADMPCSAVLYKADGTQIATISSDEMVQTYAITLTQGTYYAIVYNTTGEGETTTVSLMDNQVPTPVIDYAAHTVTISCGKVGADIYYTLDGTTPTVQSNKYSAPFAIDRNCTVKAIATYSGMDNSEVASYYVDDFKVETPTITFANLHAYISSATEGATIRYTLDGNDPLTKGKVYTEPVAITANCTVKAVATRSNYHDSEVATLDIDVSNVTTATPVVERQGDNLMVTCLTQGARLYYTTDGTTPTAESQQTDGLIRPPHNCTVKVIAMSDGELPSAVVTVTVDWMQAEKPSFVFTDGRLTIVCNTPGAVIYYEIGDATPTRASAVYSEPLTLVDNRPVHALAVAPNFNDSEVGEYKPDAFTCDEPVLAYNGRYLTMTTATEGGTIRYTLDGTTPGSNAAEYTGVLEISELLTVCAITMKANTNSSTVATLKVQSYYDGQLAETAQEGTLSQAFAWCGTSNIDRLTLKGIYGDADMQWLRQSLTALEHLDMSQARMTGNQLTAETFRDLRVLTLSVPQSVTQAGSGLFDGCQRIAALHWNPSFRLTEAMLGTLADNPNLLVYARTRGYAPASLQNVVVDGHADRIVLSDGEGNANFYCPEPFTADNISYTHHYAQQTGLNDCRGWETLCLPFTVQTVSHSTQGAAAPFAADRQNGEKPFYLCSLSGAGFEDAATIEANTPYIIAMPNHPTYADEYLLCGNVTFSAQNVRVSASDVLTEAHRGTMTLTPAFHAVAKNDGMLVLNVGLPFEGYAEGSAFLTDIETGVRPFQAYVREQNVAVRAILIGEQTTEISSMTCIQELTEGRQHVFDLQGRPIQEQRALGKGVYIVGGRQLLVK